MESLGALYEPDDEVIKLAKRASLPPHLNLLYRHFVNTRSFVFFDIFFVGNE